MALVYPLGLASTDFSDGETTSGFQPQNFIYGAHFTVASAGTVVQMGVKARYTVLTPRAVKFGLYNSGGTLVVQSTATVASNVQSWVDSGTVSAAVSAGTYYVLVSAENDEVVYGFDTAGDGSFATEVYATAMAASESITAQGDTAKLYGVRMDLVSGPTITAQPANTQINEHNRAGFSITATGGTITYQWQDNRSGSFANTTDGTGATSASHTTGVLQVTDSGRLYRCVATDAGGNTTSNSASVTVVPRDVAPERPRTRARSGGTDFGTDTREWWG